MEARPAVERVLGGGGTGVAGGGVLRRGPRVSSGGHSDATPCVVLEKAMLLTGALEYKVQV